MMHLCPHCGLPIALVVRKLPLSGGSLDEIPIEQIELPWSSKSRFINAMQNNDIRTIGQAKALDDAELLQMESLGKTSVNHFRSKYGYCSLENEPASIAIEVGGVDEKID